MVQQPLVGNGLFIIKGSWSHSHAPPLDEWSVRRRDLCLTTHSNHEETDIHSRGIRTRNPSKRAAADPRLRPRGHWDRKFTFLHTNNSKSRLFRWVGWGGGWLYWLMRVRLIKSRMTKSLLCVCVRARAQTLWPYCNRLNHTIFFISVDIVLFFGGGGDVELSRRNARGVPNPSQMRTSQFAHLFHWNSWRLEFLSRSVWKQRSCLHSQHTYVTAGWYFQWTGLKKKSSSWCCSRLKQRWLKTISKTKRSFELDISLVTSMCEMVHVTGRPKFSVTWRC